MKTTKMSLANIQGKLSISVLKNIMAGSRSMPTCNSKDDCSVSLPCCVNCGGNVNGYQGVSCNLCIIHYQGTM